MQRPSLSEWLIVQPALNSLADYFRNEIELVAELDAKFFPSDEIPGEIDGEKLIDTDPGVSFDARAWKAFREADEVLRRYGLTIQADEILRLYGDDCANAERTLVYVEALLADLNPAKDRKESEGTEDAAPDLQPDGPVPPDAFCWRGKGYDEIPPTPWRLVDSLWTAKNRTREIASLGEPVWKDHVILPDENAITACRKVTNAFFSKHDIPFRVRKKGDYVSLIDAPRE